MLTFIFVVWFIAALISFISGLILAIGLLLKIGMIAFVIFIAWVIWKVVFE